MAAAANGEVSAAVAAASALHLEGRTAAAASFGVTATTAVHLDGILVAAVPATVSAGLRTRRRRNRQCGDARGKE
jgi:hypothetical protein